MLRYRIDSQRGVVTVTGSGSVTSDEIAAWRAALRRDPEFDPSFAMLVDLRSANLGDVGASDMRWHADVDPFGPASYQAFLVADDADYGAIRIYGAYRDLSRQDGSVRAFRDPEQALAWLDEVRGNGAEPSDL
jgi:hypothetical protein